jgi:hypothetical protein
VNQQNPRAFGFDTRWGGFGYVVICSVSLVALIILVRPGLSRTTQLAYFSFGAVGILFRMSVAPIFMVLTTGFLLVVPQWGWFGDTLHAAYGPTLRFETRDLMMALAMLGFVVGHYRLQALGRHAFPPDYRFAYLERVREMPSELWRLMAEKRRGAELVKPLELVQTLASLPMVVVMAQATGMALGRARGFLDWSGALTRLAVVMAVMSLGFFTIRAFLRLWQRLTMTHEEAHMMLQDLLWHELRGPVRLVSRWLAWQKQSRE